MDGNLHQDFVLNLSRSHCRMKHVSNNPPYWSKNQKMSRSHGMLACIPLKRTPNATTQVKEYE